MALGLVVVIGTGVAACGRAAPPSHEPSLRGAEKAVRSFFDALARKDCAAVDRVLGGPFGERIRAKGGCRYLVEEHPISRAKLVGVTRVRRDGRAMGVFIVSIVIDKQEGKGGSSEKKALVRVAWQGGRYRLVEL